MFPAKVGYRNFRCKRSLSYGYLWRKLELRVEDVYNYYPFITATFSGQQ